MCNARSHALPLTLAWRGFLLMLGVVALICLEPSASAQTDPRPPPINVEYLQYGVSLHSLTLLSGGAGCPAGALTTCIVGSRGGPALRAGYRSRRPWFIGADDT